MQDLVEGLALTPRGSGASFLLRGWSRKVVVALASPQRCLQPPLLPASPLRRAALVFTGAELEGSLPSEHRLPDSLPSPICHLWIRVNPSYCLLLANSSWPWCRAPRSTAGLVHALLTH